MSMKSYPFEEIEPKWRSHWQKLGLFKADENAEPREYILEMFAYPSGDIHIGHFRNYTIGDVVTRFRLMQGYQVLHPFGWDAFGLPAEEAAIKRGIHPREWTLNNIETSRGTLQRMGLSYDWDREIITCLPDYYKWNQWIFIQLFKKGLAYQAESLVNWCPSCKTVLANEQVEAGKCWRCHSDVIKRELMQWFFKITAYAERLLNDIDRLDQWPEHVRAMQRYWIGRSEGAEIEFRIEGEEASFRVFTTRPDTVYGVTFMAISPEHPMARRLVEDRPEQEAVLAYIDEALRRSEIERTSVAREKDGVFTGRYAVNPFSGERVQLWVADYVLAGYGTGVVMGVPAHDQRDFEFATKYRIPIRVVIHPPGEELSEKEMDRAYEEPGVMVNSGPFNGLPSEQGIEAVTKYAEEKGIGGFKVTYRLRDWLVSRQRYWGTPIPMVHCPDCGVVPVPEDQLPVRLPEGEIDFIPKGRSPLADVREFVETTCPQCGGQAERDCDTMDTFVDSSWYHLRYLDPKNDRLPFRREKAEKWMPIDLYIGGVEHATGHLLYFRFLTKFLYDIGLVQVDEPAIKLFNHGMVLDEHGEVMSKSKGNVVSPADLLDRFGVDVPRLAMLFAAPSDKEIRWSEKGIRGAQRFVNRIYSAFQGFQFTGEPQPPNLEQLNEEERSLYRKLHQTIRAVTDDINRMEFNTAIASLMELLNAYEAQKEASTNLRGYVLYCVARLLAPLAPHLGEECWRLAGGRTESVFRAEWPEYDEAAAAEEIIEVVVQVNGKVRDKVPLPATLSESELKEIILSRERVQNFLGGKPPRRVIVVRNKLVNVVT
jgi:leucyl-tRNA synthetase